MTHGWLFMVQSNCSGSSKKLRWFSLKLRRIGPVWLRYYDELATPTDLPPALGAARHPHPETIPLAATDIQHWHRVSGVLISGTPGTHPTACSSGRYELSWLPPFPKAKFLRSLFQHPHLSQNVFGKNCHGK